LFALSFTFEIVEETKDFKQTSHTHETSKTFATVFSDFDCAYCEGHVSVYILRNFEKWRAFETVMSLPELSNLVFSALYAALIKRTESFF
jgi:sensor histidine kinase YesM